jgi:hypothetical protein
MYSSHSHIRNLPLLTNLETSRETNLRGLGSFNEAVAETRECAQGERARSRCTPESRQTRAIRPSPRNLVTPLYYGHHSADARHVDFHLQNSNNKQ